MKNIINNPSCFITRNKQRLKQYDNIVYLNNGEEFEIELFNPTQNKILAKIEFNGKSISSGGLVLKPGQRVFLERFLDENKKLLFDTYFVENSEITEKAISNNGLLKINFYNETTYDFQLTNWSGILNINNKLSNTITTNPYTFTYATNTFSNSNNLINDITSSNVYLNNVRESIETGRVEKGSYSNQKLKNDNSIFSLYCFHQIEWKILPKSQKSYTSDEIITYCGSCGSKKKKITHKFCPHCGNKY